jgi:hypothetical protein
MQGDAIARGGARVQDGGTAAGERLVIEVCVAFKAHLGWVNAVAVRRRAGAVDCLDARRVDLVGGADRQLREPYHVAGGWNGLARSTPPRDPGALIQRARQRQAVSAADALVRYRDALQAAGLEWRLAVLFTARGRAGGDLERILSSHAQIHVAEGEAIRDATRLALDTLRIDRMEQDEKAVAGLAGAALRVQDPDALLKSSRPAGIAAWRKEERLLALGAWLHGR